MSVRSSTHRFEFVLSLICAAMIGTLTLSSCGGGSGGGDTGGRLLTLSHVFAIAMENTDASSIYGNAASAPYINGTLIPKYAIATNFLDELSSPDLPSEPHYVLMEAGTNAFADHTFTTDDDPSAANSTADPDHLVQQIDASNGRLSWVTYQEGIDATSGACPIASSGFYDPRHNPFVFFQDVSGNPPAKTNVNCAAHHKPLSALAGDLADNAVASYNFITPNECHNMHGESGCPNSDLIRSGDDWLAANLPALIQFVSDGSGVIFVVWDEGSGSAPLPFLAIGPTVKSGHASGATLTHRSLVKSIEEIFGLPVLPRVNAANDFSDLF